MGREVKRVPLDFDWPLYTVWEGYVNPHYKACPEANKTCFGGYTAAGEWLRSIVRLLMLAGTDGLGPRRNGIWPHPYLQEFTLAPKHNDHVRVVEPTDELTTLTDGLSGRTVDEVFGYDAIATHRAYKKVIEASGLNPDTRGVCPVCHGHDIDPTVKEAYDNWERVAPPTGDGWQVWETVSEGAPISRVFPTAEALVAHLIESGHSRDAAENFVTLRWVPSMTMGPEGVKMGIDCAEVDNGATD